MALPPSGMSDEAFLREVDEEYRREQVLNVWRRYGRWIVGAVVVGLLALALYLYLGQNSRNAAGKQGEEFDAALMLAAGNQNDKALAEFDKIAKSGGNGYAAMSKITAGNLLLQKNDAKAAAAKFAEVANDSGLAKPYRDLALLRQTVAEYDSLKPEVVIDRLKNLAKPDSPWFGTAGEMVAASHLKLGHRDQAGKLYGQIAQGGENVPESIRQRAVQIAGVLGVDALDQSKEKQAQ